MGGSSSTFLSLRYQAFSVITSFVSVTFALSLSALWIVRFLPSNTGKYQMQSLQMAFT